MSHFEKESLVILQNLAVYYKYEVTQKNGQRIFGPPLNWEGRKPGIDCEVFISNINPRSFEINLLSVLLRCGDLYMLRFMLSFSSVNRGYAFARFKNPLSAYLACITLNGLCCDGHILNCVPCLNKNRLYIGKLDIHEMEFNKFLDAIYNNIENVDRITLFKPDYKGKYSAILEFDEHKHAAMGRRRLCDNRGFSRECYIAWYPQFRPRTEMALDVDLREGYIKC